jgi:cob(I)alamin adenosyltransferase
MKIYTKTGDDGTTALYGGRRVSKTNLRIEAFGTIDELNSYIGLLADITTNPTRIALLREVQDRLFTIGALIAADPEKPQLKLPELFETDVEILENEIDKMTDTLPPQQYFILPGGHTAVSYCHLARVVCRRAERICVYLQDEEIKQYDLILKYLNRLSDYLFVLARMVGVEHQVNEIYWIPKKQ